MTKRDRDALERALAIVKQDPELRDRFLSKVEENGWESAAISAAYHCQIETLSLKPWESPPCFGDVRPIRNQHEEKAAALLQRMLDAGLSKYEPDPAGALEE